MRVKNLVVMEVERTRSMKEKLKLLTNNLINKIASYSLMKNFRLFK